MRSSFCIAAYMMTATLATTLHSSSQGSSEKELGVSAQAVRAAILGRHQYIPSEQQQLVVDRCSLLEVLGPEQVDTVVAEVAHSVRFSGCGSGADTEEHAVVWKLLDAMRWPRTAMLAVEISRQEGTTVQRERYTIEDDAFLSELTLSHYGVFD